MEAIFSSETSVDFQRITRRYIPEDGTLLNHRCENLESYILTLTLRRDECSLLPPNLDRHLFYKVLHSFGDHV
jgi:hypothetical protein